ncbi:bifunctional 3-(3-hydroxy-phenyl)propionate/3-hydroxycinnamic acid hydroxylase [Rhizobium halophytocola]|uniref:bifunctional 3-(3-hydroxy-phenyl)propionate/3-hydroxycinnamic acid hydroxylase n=1 Tax=Rhizobium halophytocola TaxID=735519 RepID=UPI00315818CB
MLHDTRIEDHVQVLVVGFGPAGAVAAGILGRLGHRTLVIDRLTEIYDRPRAIAIDHEILRHFDNMGIADEVMPFIAPFTASQHFGAKGQLIRRIDMVPEPYPLGYTPSMVFTQPPVEAILRKHAQTFDCVEIALGLELIAARQEQNWVIADIKAADGTVRTVTCDYLIGCDGASSTVRQLAGMRLEDLIFDEPWLVIDVQVDDSALEKLPQTSAQFCDPARPISFIIGPKNHRRWEIMLLPGENPRDMENPENVWQLLSPWLQPADGTLWRAAAYRFHALLADRWREGRIFIAGDAAHQQPPFIGQGMCQGLRDVTNLIWKIDRVLKRQSPDTLLDTYAVERSRHVRELTGKIKAIGEMICIRDPEQAATRDERILAEGGGEPRVITRQEIVPPIQDGMLAGPDVPARGTLFPQPAIHCGDKVQLMDKLTGSGWRLVLDGRSDIGNGVPRLDPALGISVYQVAQGDAGQAPDGMLLEADNVLGAWFDRYRVRAAFVRPDHYVFGTARSAAELMSQLGDLQRHLG